LIKLTKRQEDVLLWIQRGLSNKQIGARLGMTESTVKTHVSKLFKAYHVQNRQQLVAFSSQNKKVELPTDLESKPFGWVKRKGDKILGVVFITKQPDKTWEAMYVKTEQQETK